MTKLYLSYDLQNCENSFQLNRILSSISRVLESQKLDVYCPLYAEENNDDKSPKELREIYFEELTKADIYMPFIEFQKSTPLEIEIKHLREMKKEPTIIGLKREGLVSSLDDKLHDTILFESNEDLLDKLKNYDFKLN